MAQETVQNFPQQKRTFLGILRYSFFSSLGVYALSVTLFLVARLFLTENTMFVGLLNSLIHLLVIPGLFLLPVAVWARQKSLSVLFLPSVIAFLVWNIPLLLPVNTPEASPDAVQITVLSYNLKAQTETNSLDAIAEIIRRADADIVGLQEVSQAAAAYFEEAFEVEYPYQEASTFPNNGIGGQGILSRYPIEDYEAFRTHFTQQEAVIDLNGQRISLYNVHIVTGLHSGHRRRNADTQQVLDRSLQNEYPVILLGDFNATERSDSYQAVLENYRDAFYEVGQGLGWTHIIGVPLSRLDYIFYDEGFTALEAHVLSDSGGSDHLPVQTVLALTQS